MIMHYYTISPKNPKSFHHSTDMLSVFSARAPFNNLLRAFRARVFFARPPPATTTIRDPTRFNHHSDKLSEVVAG